MSLLARARSERTAGAWARALRRFRVFCAEHPKVSWTNLGEDDLVLFLRDVAAAGLAATTIGRLMGDLSCALSLLGVVLPGGRRVELLRHGLAAFRPPPAPGVEVPAVADLLRGWSAMPKDTPLARRDRAIVLLAILLGLRPADVLAMGRDQDFLVLGPTAVRLRLLGDKGSLLSRRPASRWLVLCDSPLIPVRETIQLVLDDLPRERVYPRIDPPLIFFPLFVRYDREAFGKPLQAVTVSRILRRFLEGLGLEPDRAKASRLRSYAASAAYELGIDIQELCLHFRWASPGTFLQHYYRRGVETALVPGPSGPRDGSRVSLAFAMALERSLVNS